MRDQASLLEAIGHAVMATDPAGKVIYWNRSAETLCGWHSGEVLGRKLREFALPPSVGAGGFLALPRRGESWGGRYHGAASRRLAAPCLWQPLLRSATGWAR